MRLRYVVARLILALGLISAPLSSGADVIADCGRWASTEYLIEPWDQTSRTFSRGSIRLAVLDLGEPDCCPKHIAILIPANMYGGRACFLVARNALIPNGWAKVGLDEVEASRGSEPGLVLSVPVYTYDYRSGGADPASREVIRLRIRQAAGTVELER